VQYQRLGLSHLDRALLDQGFAATPTSTHNIACKPLPYVFASLGLLPLHTGLEVALGGAVGVCGAMAADRFAGAPPSRLRIKRLAVTTVFVLVLLHGIHMPAEAAIRSAALDMWPLSSCR